jgi:molecular chaperone DnaK (HSP70)
MYCPSCKKWEITQFDSFCSWCRTKLVDFAASFNVDHLCVGDLAPDTLTLTLTHTGSVGKIQIDRIESSEPWLIAHTEQVADLSLQVGRDVVVPMEVDLMALSDDYHDVRLVVTSDVGGTREAVLEVTPRPKFQINTGSEHTILLDNVQDEIMSGYLAVTRGILTVESLTTDMPWATVELTQSKTLPCKLDQRDDNRLEFLFRVDEPYLLGETARDGQALPAEYKGTLVVKLAEFEEQRKETFRVKCFLPPMLYIPESEGSIRIPVFAGKRAELNLTLQNGERDELGHANLQIQEIRIDAPWLQLSGSVTYPLNIGSGQYHGLTLSATTLDLSEGVHPARITFVTNTPGELREKHIPVDIEVRSMPVFDGTLAIDFGTNNSCCGFLDPQGVLTLVPIGEPGDLTRTTNSSAILYQDLFDANDKDYVIGNEAYALSFEPSNAFSAVRQVKRRLGTDKPYEVTFQLDPDKRASYRPREVASDIIRRILERAEERVGGRIASCTISHPSRFSLRQLEDLKEAVVACGIEKSRIKTVHEPVGAAIDFIQQKVVRKEYEQYHLMVFDFGGGTTDITLLRVQNEQLTDKDLTVVTPEVLGATGDRWFGGEDVTDMVMGLVLSRCESLLRARNPEALNVKMPFNQEDFTDPRKKRLAQGNRNFLRFWAEAAKIAISTYGDEHQDALVRNAFIDGHNIKARLPSDFPLAVIVDNDVRPTETFFHDEVVPRQEELDEQLRPRLEKIALMMQRLARNNDIEVPEIIMISGKSSALPVVRQVISEYFPSSRIERPADAKECVVRGACQLSNPDPIKGVYIRHKNSGALSATTSRLGLRVTDTGVAMFHEVIDAGIPIAPEGLHQPVSGIVLKREARIRIMENTSLEDAIMLDGQLNPNITELRVFRLDTKLDEWEQRNGRQVTDQDLFNTETELIVTPNLLVRLVARVPGVDELIEFEAEAGGW